MIDPKDPQSIANSPDAIRALALEAGKDLGPLLQVVAQAVVLHGLDPMWLEYVARHYAEAHEDIPVPKKPISFSELVDKLTVKYQPDFIREVRQGGAVNGGLFGLLRGSGAISYTENDGRRNAEYRVHVGTAPWGDDGAREAAAARMRRFLGQEASTDDE